jgi:hypothetical protein
MGQGGDTHLFLRKATGRQREKRAGAQKRFGTKDAMVYAKDAKGSERLCGLRAAFGWPGINGFIF